jgi:hypothetical protein
VFALVDKCCVQRGSAVSCEDLQLTSLASSKEHRIGTFVAAYVDDIDARACIIPTVGGAAKCYRFFTWVVYLEEFADHVGPLAGKPTRRRHVCIARLLRMNGACENDVQVWAVEDISLTVVSIVSRPAAAVDPVDLCTLMLVVRIKWMNMDLFLKTCSSAAVSLQ